MTQVDVTGTMKTHLSKTGASLLLVSLAACGSSGATSARDAGDTEDSGSSADGSETGEGGAAADGGRTVDSGGSTDSGNAIDGTTSPQPVNLATSGGYAILAKSGIATVPTSAVTGNMGVSPAAATYITGFSLTADSTNVFATSPQVIGKVYASDYSPPTPSNLTTAIGDMQLAFTDAAGRAADVTELGAGNVGGKTLSGGVYAWSTGLLIPTDVTLSGSPTDVWIFQIAQDLTVSSAARVVLAGGASAGRVFWEVAGSADLGTTAHFEGTILSKTGITLHTGASINGRLLAQTAVSIDGSTVVQP